MRVAILGGTGMLGHKMHDVLARNHEVVSTTRRPLGDLPVDAREFLGAGRVVEHVDATDFRRLEELIDEIAPQVLINCVGVIKQRDAARDAIPSITINSLLPHRLAGMCSARGIRMLHFSTDCVFSGSTGDYAEDSFSDAADLYGRSKYLGEVDDARALTIRTSIIGRELDHFQSLVEWFLMQEGEVRGYTKAIYTGVTTEQAALIVGRIIEEAPDLAGIYQVASAKISKFELLTMIREVFGLGDRIRVEPFDEFFCDRSLRGERFEGETGIAVPSWPQMIEELADDAPRYRKVKQ